MYSEEKIDRFEDRLAGIENALNDFASRYDNLNVRINSTKRDSRSRLAESAERSQTTKAGGPTPAFFEGETGINRQSDYARELLTHAVEDMPSIGQNAEIKTALSALKQLVTEQGRVARSSHPGPQSLDRCSGFDSSKLNQPPWNVVEEAIEKAMRNVALI